MQCLRRWIVSGHASQKYNAMKYALSLLTQLLCILDDSQIFWGISAVVSTFFSYYWDIVHDWGLLKNTNTSTMFDRKAKFLLRNTLMIGSRKFYYSAMVSNFLLRITWVITISPNVVSGLHTDVLLLLLGTLEVLRRSQWNLLRLEYEHVGNCENNVAVKNVDLGFLRSIDSPKKKRGDSDVDDDDYYPAERESDEDDGKDEDDYEDEDKDEEDEGLQMNEFELSLSKNNNLEDRL